jgi:hypothetical protein
MGAVAGVFKNVFKNEKSNMKLGIVIVSFGNIQVTFDCIKSILKNSSNNVIVLIINNTVTNNLGYAGGCNKGFYILRGCCNYVILMNNDCLFFKTTIPQILEHINNNDIGDFACPVVMGSNNQINYDGGNLTFIGAKHFKKGSFRAYKTKFMYGCCIIVKTESFIKIGKFREQYFMYWEDVDFSYRAVNQGYKTKCLGDVFVQHDNKSQFGLMRYYHTRNALLYATLNYSTGRYTAFIFYFFLYFVPVRVIYFAFKKKWTAIKYMLIGIKDYFLGRTGKYGENK